VKTFTFESVIKMTQEVAGHSKQQEEQTENEREERRQKLSQP